MEPRSSIMQKFCSNIKGVDKKKKKQLKEGGWSRSLEHKKSSLTVTFDKWECTLIMQFDP